MDHRTGGGQQGGSRSGDDRAGLPAVGRGLRHRLVRHHGGPVPGCAAGGGDDRRAACVAETDPPCGSGGAADRDTEMGKVIGQFKSFAFASTQQVLIGRLQQKDLAALTGFAGAVAMGMFSFYLKRTIQGKELPNDPNVWLVEGIDRSGYLGIMSEFTNIANKVSRGSFSVGATPSRYASRNVAASLAGPSVSLIDDSATTIGALMTQDISEGDAKAMWRMIPFNNVAYFTALQEKFAESVANK